MSAATGVSRSPLLIGRPEAGPARQWRVGQSMLDSPVQLVYRTLVDCQVHKQDRTTAAAAHTVLEYHEGVLGLRDDTAC